MFDVTVHSQLVVLDEEGRVVMSLGWRRNSRDVCFRFLNSRLAKGSFKVLAGEYGIGDI